VLPRSLCSLNILNLCNFWQKTLRTKTTYVCMHVLLKIEVRDVWRTLVGSRDVWRCMMTKYDRGGGKNWSKIAWRTLWMAPYISPLCNYAYMRGNVLEKCPREKCSGSSWRNSQRLTKLQATDYACRLSEHELWGLLNSNIHIPPSKQTDDPLSSRPRHTNLSFNLQRE